MQVLNTPRQTKPYIAGIDMGNLKIRNATERADGWNDTT